MSASDQLKARDRIVLRGVQRVFFDRTVFAIDRDLPV
jgi:hypothetical protein